MSAAFFFMNFCIIGVGFTLWLHREQTPRPLLKQTQFATESDRIFPYFTMKEIPIRLLGLFISAIFSAGISTLDLAITEASDISINNIYTRNLTLSVSENHYLRTAKFSISMGVCLFPLGDISQSTQRTRTA